MDDRLNRATPDELARARRHAATPTNRWHCRYIAAEVAWQAAALMPDQSDATADALCEAGSWLKARDPKSADRFYKALARRCSQTPLGHRAAILHWFPLDCSLQPQPTFPIAP